MSMKLGVTAPWITEESTGRLIGYRSASGDRYLDGTPMPSEESGSGSPTPSIQPLTEHTVSASEFGLFPDGETDQSSLIEYALNQANSRGKWLVVAPGSYVYSRAINVNTSLNRVGLVCLAGEAHFKFVGSNLNDASISVTRPGGSGAGTYVAGFKLHGIKFSQPNRADTGLRNDAQEGGSALRLTYVEKVEITHCRFEHLYGSAMVLRHVRDVMIAYNVIRDIFKDGFHITGESSNIWRCFNVVDAGGDDAFPVVGYTNLTEKPRYIYDIGNRVRGVRYARAFAYVGCSDVVNDDNYVDGLIPDDIPQKLSPLGEALNTRSGLYIAAEVFGATPSEKTYGNERITVTGLRITNTAPSGVAGQTTGYDSITIYSQNASNEDISIQGSVRNIAGRGVIVAGAQTTRRLKLDLSVEENRDPLGLAGTAGNYAAPAVEFQRTRDIDVTLRVKNIGNGAVYTDLNCAGTFKANVSFDSVNMNTGNSWSVIQGDQSVFYDADIRVESAGTVPVSGAGSVLYSVVTMPNNCRRKLTITGNNLPSAGVGGWNQRQLTSGASGTKTLPTSPATYINVSDVTEGVMQVPVSNAMNVSAVSLVRAIHLLPVDSLTGTTAVVRGDVQDRYTTSTATVAFIDSRGFVLSSAQTPTNVAYASRNTTLTFASVPAETAFIAQLQTQVAQTGRANAPQMLPKGLGMTITYSGSVDLKVFQSEV